MISDQFKPSDEVEGDAQYLKRRALEKTIAPRADVGSHPDRQHASPKGDDAAPINQRGRQMVVSGRIEMNTRHKAAEQAGLSKAQLRNIRVETAHELSRPAQDTPTHHEAYARKHRGLLAEKALAQEGGIALNDVKPNSPVYDHLFYRESASVKTHLVNEERPNQHVAAYAHDLRVATGATEAHAGKYAGKSGPSFAAVELKQMEIPGFDTSHAGPREVEKYLKDTASIRIPSDHVDEAKEYIRNCAADAPEKYGLHKQFTKAELNELVDRVKPLPITSDQLVQSAELEANKQRTLKV